MQTIKIIITGKVQGVFFRDHTKKTALNMKIKGWVRNRSNGTVEVLAQGEKGTLSRFVKWCHQGSPASEVKSVISTPLKTNETFQNFVVKK